MNKIKEAIDTVDKLYILEENKNYLKESKK